MNVRIQDDLDLKKIADSGQCFRWTPAGETAYRVISRDRCVYIEKTGEAQYSLDCTEEEFGSFWSSYLDLSLDYRGIRERISGEKDPFLAAAAESGKGIRILRQDPWEMLVSFIISQNKNIPAIRASIERLSSMAGQRMTDRRGREYFAFPGPEQVAALTEGDLSECRLGYRCRYVHSAAEAVLSGDLDLRKLEKMSDEEALKELTGLFGVGIKVASCVLLFGLHHLDSFPVDVWIRRALEEHYPGGYPLEQYRPWNGIYQQYMFAYYRNLRP